MLNEVKKRAKAPTPKFFKKVRTIGLILTGVGTAILTAPVSLPATLITIGGYLLTGGTIAAAIAQVTVEDTAKNLGKD